MSTAFSRLYSRLAMETVPTLADILLDFLLIEIRYEKKTDVRSFTKILSHSAEILRIGDKIVKRLHKFAPYLMFSC